MAKRGGKATRPDDGRLRKNRSDYDESKTPRGKSKKKSVMISVRMQQILDGELKIEDLDDEEIFKGRVRAEDGTFRGTPAEVIPRQFYAAATQELMRRWQARVNEKLEPALEVLSEIANNKKLPADARYKSAVYLIERAAGKVPDKAEMKVEVAKWEEDIEGLFFDPKAKDKE